MPKLRGSAKNSARACSWQKSTIAIIKSSKDSAYVKYWKDDQNTQRERTAILKYDQKTTSGT